MTVEFELDRVNLVKVNHHANYLDHEVISYESHCPDRYRRRTDCSEHIHTHADAHTPSHTHTPARLLYTATNVVCKYRSVKYRRNIVAIR